MSYITVERMNDIFTMLHIGVWHRLWHEAEFTPLKRGVA